MNTKTDGQSGSVDVSRDGTRCAWDVAFLTLLVLAIYFTRLSALTIRGEESRRARVAVEMIESGDWIVPTQQKQIYFSRPPLQNWLIAGFGQLRGSIDAVAIRLPSVLSILVLSWVVFGYARTFLSPPGALLAGAGFATMVEVMKLGRLGESDALFAALLGGGLLIWHWGYVKKWPAGILWCVPYTMVALATLTKGPQAPVYFVGAICLFLILQRDFRTLFGRWHFAGVALFIVVVAAWQVPYQCRLGWEATVSMYTTTSEQRVNGADWMSLLSHMAAFPWEWLACMLPWSGLPAAYAFPSFRRQIGTARPHVVFLMTCLAVAFPTCWFIPYARTRYLLAVYPCVACLAALVADRCWMARPDAKFRKTWIRLNHLTAVVMICVAAAIGMSSFVLSDKHPFAQPVQMAVPFALTVAVLAAVLFRNRWALTIWQRRLAVVCTAGFLGLTYADIGINILMQRGNATTEAAVAELKDQLPSGTRLVSLGRIEHLFAFYYADPIPVVPLDDLPVGDLADWDYFCCDLNRVGRNEIPFAYETLAEISCDRDQSATPQRIVLVGRRLSAPRHVSATHGRKTY